MDLVRSWLIAAVVLLGINLVLSVIVDQHISAVFLLGPFLAGAAACLYHAERGVGSWGRHAFAVLPVPAVLQVYRTFVQEGIPSGGQEWSSLLFGMGFTTVITALGLGAVMLARLLMMTKDDALRAS